MSVIAPRYGGPSSVIFPLCEALSQMPGVQVELATTDADGPGERIDASQVKASFPVHVFRRTLSERWQYAPQMGRWLRANAARFDLLHIHALWTYGPASAARAARRAGVPYIVRPAGMLSDYTLARRRVVKRAAWLARERALVQHAAGFHATSEEERDEILRLRSDARVSVVPNGIADAAWTTRVRRFSDDGFERLGGKALRRPIVLFLSRLHPKKGIVDLLLPAFARMTTRASLVIAGGEDERAVGYESEVQAAIGRLGLQDCVAMVGSVGAREKWELYDLADVFVLPSHTENFGIVVAEAMARGKPVVVTTGVQFAQHVCVSGGGSVVRPDSGDLAAALDHWLLDPAARARGGEVARAYVQEHLKWCQIAARLVDLYQRVCKPECPAPTQ